MGNRKFLNGKKEITLQQEPARELERCAERLLAFSFANFSEEETKVIYRELEKMLLLRKYFYKA